MRLKSPKARSKYVDLLEREPYTKDDAPEQSMIGRQNPNGNPIKGATTWYFRGLTSGEEAMITDAMIDLGNTTAAADKSGKNVKLNTSMSISPSKARDLRVRMALTGWDNLAMVDPDDPENLIALEFEAETFEINGTEVEGAPQQVLDMLDRKILQRMSEFARSLTEVEPGMGEQ